MKTSILSVLFLLLAIAGFGANGQIVGKVTDEKGESLIGANIQVEGTGLGAKTDIDGKFTIKGLKDSTYTLLVSYIAYEKKSISDIVIDKGNTVFLSITLNKIGKGLKELVVKTAMKKESINALLIQQKNLSTISDGISAESIRKTADRNTGDVLKRVSGVTIAENKFAVIRGLADRYNMAMLNGDILPSSEADRKAFSFDVFPSNLLESITIIKAATPDRPAEFAGGIIDLTTKDPSKENFAQIQVGSGMNTISTFKSYHDSKNSKTDWLGYDKSLRVLPENFPTREQFFSSNSAFSIQQRVEASKSLNNSWGTTLRSSMSPFRNLQLSGGYSKSFSKDMSLGVIGAVSYSRASRTYFIERSELNGNTVAYNFNDTLHKDNVLIGGLLNVGFRINANHRIKFMNTFSLNADDQTIRRSGDFIDNEEFIKGTALWFSNNQLLSNQLSSEHIISRRKIKLQLGVGRNGIVRTIPDLRKTYYQKKYDDTVYRAYIPLKASPNFSGRFFANTNEVIYSGNADVTVPYKFGKTDHSLKAGIYLQSKNRDYDARVLGYQSASNGTIISKFQVFEENELFSPEKMYDKGLVIGDVTQPQDQYTADSKLNAAYIMSDNKVMDKLRFVWGVRVEQFNQRLLTQISTKELEVKKDNTNFLPSLNFTYLMNKRTNLRFCASQTLSRPEFREIAPSSFYDYSMSATYIGNTELEQTNIQNYDVRYEYFFGKGEMISSSLFYKKFDNPIEAVIPMGIASTQKVFSYQNAPTANAYGIEFEFRKSLSFLASNEKSTLNNLVFYGNLAYIKSSVEISSKTASGEDLKNKRPMQGQSPYIINGGISYSHPVYNFSTALVYNRIGERIAAVGNGEIPDMYEAPRNVLDFSISKKFAKKFEAKFTVSDILSNPVVFYYNVDEKFQIDDKHAYSKKNDYRVISMRQGTNIGLSVSYQFK